VRPERKKDCLFTGPDPSFPAKKNRCKYKPEAQAVLTALSRLRVLKLERFCVARLSESSMVISFTPDSRVRLRIGRVHTQRYAGFKTDASA